MRGGFPVLIDFNDMTEQTIPGMNNGSGYMSVKMFRNEKGKIIPCRLHPGCSIGKHKQSTSDDINYVISGEGIAVCDGVEEKLTAGCCHICPKGSEHSIINVGKEDLVLLTVVVEQN